jgi:hypothetical protein
VNVLVFDVFFLPSDSYGALASATIYTLLLVVILACNRELVMRAIRALIPAASTAPTRSAWLIVATLTIMGLLFAVDQMLVNLFGH